MISNPNGAGMGGEMGTANPNGDGRTEWASTDKSLVGNRAVDAVLGDMKDNQISCPDCDFKTVFQDSMKQHQADCARQAEIFKEREKNQGISEEKVAEMIKEATAPMTSTLNDIVSLLKGKAAKPPKKKKRAVSKKKDEVKQV